MVEPSTVGPGLPLAIGVPVDLLIPKVPLFYKIGMGRCFNIVEVLYALVK